jgi:small subunit ribosomal protein S2
MKKELSLMPLMEAGVHFGYSRTRRHPTVAPFLYGTKGGVDIIDLEKTAPMMEAAANFLSELSAAGKSILLVGTKPEARNQILSVAGDLKQPYVTERWIGGMLTNFPEIKKRINRLETLRDDKTSGAFEKYTKKEQLLLTREMERLNKYFNGLTGLTKMPDAVIVIDSKKEHIAIAEARKIGVPIIAIGNTDCSVRGITYPIIANDSSASSIKTILGLLKDAFTTTK